MALFESVGCLNCHYDRIKRWRLIMPEAIELTKEPIGRAAARVTIRRRLARAWILRSLQRTKRQRASVLSPPTIGRLFRRDPASGFRRAAAKLAGAACNACHTIDDRDNALGESRLRRSGRSEQGLPPEQSTAGRGDQSRPPLTWAGEKLRPQWSASFIAGEISYKPRPWLFARMPSFASRAKLLAAGMAMEHGRSAGGTAESAG